MNVRLLPKTLSSFPAEGLRPIRAVGEANETPTIPVRAAATDERRREPTTVPVPLHARDAEPVPIPPSPRVPFVRPRPRRSRTWRAEVVAEWVRLTEGDPRCE